SLGDRFEDAGQRFPRVGRGDDNRLHMLIERGPAVVEDRLEQAGLPLVVADELRLRGAGFAGDDRGRGLLETEAGEERLAGFEQAAAGALCAVGIDDRHSSDMVVMPRVFVNHTTTNGRSATEYAGEAQRSPGTSLRLVCPIDCRRELANCQEVARGAAKNTKSDYFFALGARSGN